MIRRSLHPGAWWLWAIALSAAVLRTHNPVLLCLIAAIAWYVVVSRRVDAPWARSYGSFLRMGLYVLILRVVFQVAFGARLPGHVLFTLPSVALPSWMAGVSLGGSVTVEALVEALYDGLQLAVLLAVIGAANSLASPYRLLRSLPTVLYEAGVAITVGLSFAPLAGESVRKVREARRLRGRAHRGIKGMRGLAVPVLESALEQSLQLAASMDSRGYGRRAMVPKGRRRIATVTMSAGLLAVLVGVYGLMDVGSPTALGLPTLGVGAVLLAYALFSGGARSTRTRYRPDLWLWPEWLTVSSAVITLASLIAVGRSGTLALQPSTTPLTMPTVPILAALGALVAVLPAFATPEPE